MRFFKNKINKLLFDSILSVRQCHICSYMPYLFIIKLYIFRNVLAIETVKHKISSHCNLVAFPKICANRHAQIKKWFEIGLDVSTFTL